jgi:N-acetylmuramoyl-L-alanine amidase
VWKKGIIWVGILALTLTIFVGLTPETSYSFGKTTLKIGSTHSDVYELQGRLSYLGFYKGKIDGQFGNQTYWAVRNFQYKFGMQVDGVVGAKTKLMLWKATQNWTPSVNRTTRSTLVSTKKYSESEIKIMARAVYGEARGEPYEGKVAVAAVILNRINSSLFPNTPSSVIFEPRAFTAVDDGQIWLEPNASAYKAVRDALNGWDPTGNALYYFNPDTATSAWIWSRPQIKKIGKHIFSR